MRLPEKIETEREYDYGYTVKRRDDEILDELVEKFNHLIDCLNKVLPSSSDKE